MMGFEFATATRIVFGAGTVRRAAEAAADSGRRAFVVTGRNPARAAVLLDDLKSKGVEWESATVSGEPTIDVALDVLRRVREFRADVVIGFGGGSVVDTGKAVAALLANPGDPMEYLEVIGRGQPLRNPSVPYIAIPTTAGTGAEVTRNAVLGSPEHHVKVSMRSPFMLPRLAVVDPELTHSMSPEVTASTGLDAFTQLLEVFVSNAANPLTDGICREGLARASRSLRRAYEDGSNAAAREDMALASLFGGLALANAKLGAAHGFAGPIGGMVPAPHGVICARLLPHVMAANVRALRDRAPDSPVLPRLDEVGRIVTGRPDATAADGVAWVEDLCRALRVPPLARFGFTENQFAAAVEKSRNASSMKGNPIALHEEEMYGILEHESRGTGS